MPDTTETDYCLCVLPEEGFAARMSGPFCIMCGRRRLAAPKRVEVPEVDIPHLIDRMAWLHVSIPSAASGEFRTRLGDSETGCRTASRFSAHAGTRLNVPAVLCRGEEQLADRFRDAALCDRLLDMERLPVTLDVRACECITGRQYWQNVADACELIARRTFDPYQTPISVCIDWGNTNLCIYSGEAGEDGMVEVHRGPGWTHEFRDQCTGRTRLGLLPRSLLAPLYGPTGDVLRACIGFKDPSVIDEEAVAGVKRAFYYGRFHSGFNVWVNRARKSFTGEQLGERFIESLAYHALHSVYRAHCRTNEYNAVPPVGLFLTHPVGVGHAKLEQVHATLRAAAQALLGGEGASRLRGVMIGPDEATASLLGSLSLLRDDLRDNVSQTVLIVDAGGSTTDLGVFELALDGDVLSVRPVAFGCCVRGGDDVTYRIYQAFLELLRHRVRAEGDAEDVRRLQSRLLDLAELTKTRPGEEHVLEESFEQLGLRTAVAAYDAQRQTITVEPDFSEASAGRNGAEAEGELLGRPEPEDDEVYLRARNGQAELDFARRIFPTVWNEIRATLMGMLAGVEQVDKVIFSGQGAELDILREGVRHLIEQRYGEAGGRAGGGLVQRVRRSFAQQPSPAELSDEDFLKQDFTAAQAEAEEREPQPLEPEPAGMFRKHRGADEAKRAVARGALIYHGGRYGEWQLACEAPRRLAAPLRIMDALGKSVELHASEAPAGGGPFEACRLVSQPVKQRRGDIAETIVFRHAPRTPFALESPVTVGVNYSHAAGSAAFVPVAEHAATIEHVTELSVGYQSAPTDEPAARRWFLRLGGTDRVTEIPLELMW